MRHASRGQGFTLVEVLVALLVLALAMGALQLRITSHLDNAAYLRSVTQAAWVARNQLELLHVASRLDAAPPLDGSSGTEQLAGLNWYWTLQVLDLPEANNPGRLVPIQIGVSDKGFNEARNSPLYSLQGVMEPGDGQ